MTETAAGHVRYLELINEVSRPLPPMPVADLGVPFMAPLTVPLEQARVMLLNSAGVHLRGEQAFEPVNDLSFRRIPAAIDPGQAAALASDADAPARAPRRQRRLPLPAAGRTRRRGRHRRGHRHPPQHARGDQAATGAGRRRGVRSRGGSPRTGRGPAVGGPIVPGLPPGHGRAGAGRGAVRAADGLDHQRPRHHRTGAAAAQRIPQLPARQLRRPPAPAGRAARRLPRCARPGQADARGNDGGPALPVAGSRLAGRGGGPVQARGGCAARQRASEFHDGAHYAVEEVRAITGLL